MCIVYRVAETLYNPFGEDDDDFELNQLLNRHFKGKPTTPKPSMVLLNFQSNTLKKGMII